MQDIWQIAEVILMVLVPVIGGVVTLLWYLFHTQITEIKVKQDKDFHSLTEDIRTVRHNLKEVEVKTGKGDAVQTLIERTNEIATSTTKTKAEMALIKNLLEVLVDNKAVLRQAERRRTDHMKDDVK